MFPKKRTANDLTTLVRQITAHVTVNNSQIDGFPLILTVNGAPGIGKTYNIREAVQANGGQLFEISASALAHHKEGMVLYPLIRAYRDASGVADRKPAAILIDDFDRSIASNYKSSGHTIHSQLLVGFLMDLCDNPYSVPDETTRDACEVRRVPIIMTTNDLSGIDAALLRPQRMRIFDFSPTDPDKIVMIRNAFGHSENARTTSLNDKDFERLLAAFKDKPIAFFSDIVAAHLSESVADAVESNRLPQEPGELRRFLQLSMKSITLKAAIEVGQSLQR